MPLDLDDIQGNILRGYRLPDVRYFALALSDATGGRALLSTLLTGTDEIPAVETAAEWNDPPRACLNVSVTSAGLRSLGVPDAALAAFPEAYRDGSAQRSIDSANDTGALWAGVGIGDVEEAAPDRWELGGPQNPAVHVVISVFTNEAVTPCREAISAALRSEFGANAVADVWSRDGNTFANGAVHFGFRDGISQPQIAGRPGGRTADMQPDVPTGDFLLGRGHLNTYNGNYLGTIPPALGDNGTYMALRVLKQEVRVFEEYIRVTGRRFDMDLELVAAKMVGRWRNGTPLSVSPDDGEAGLADDQLNNFDYASTLDHPTNFDDADGVRCPFGSHMRRMNARGGPVSGIQHNRRIIRRGVPYGPPYVYDPNAPDDGIERGLLGAFICGDLGYQFEFLQKVWANLDMAAPMIRGSRDPILGWQPAVGGRFSIPSGDSRGLLTATDMPKLVITRGSLYLFVPGIGGLRTLARGSW